MKCIGIIYKVHDAGKKSWEDISWKKLVAILNEQLYLLYFFWRWFADSSCFHCSEMNFWAMELLPRFFFFFFFFLIEYEVTNIEQSMNSTLPGWTLPDMSCCAFESSMYFGVPHLIKSSVNLPEWCLMSQVIVQTMVNSDNTHLHI